MSPEHDEIYSLNSQLSNKERENNYLKEQLKVSNERIEALTELRIQLKHRLDQVCKKLEEVNSKKKPALIANPNLSKVIQITEDHIEELETEGCDYTDSQHYLYEEIMKALYGKDVFDYLNTLYE